MAAALNAHRNLALATLGPPAARPTQHRSSQYIPARQGAHAIALATRQAVAAPRQHGPPRHRHGQAAIRQVGWQSTRAVFQMTQWPARNRLSVHKLAPESRAPGGSADPVPALSELA